MTTVVTTKNAVVFSGRNGLDFADLRMNVVRIPEVTMRLKQAQAIFDTMELTRVDLLSVISSDDEAFFRNIKLKSLVAAIVQVGLFDRYLKTQRRPDFMIGNFNGDSAMAVASGAQTFEELVSKSQAIDTLKPSEPQVARVVIPMSAEPAPLLSGLSLTEYRAMQLQPNVPGDIAPVVTYTSVGGSAMELRKMIASVHSENCVNRFINIGPASGMRGSDYKSIDSEDIESLDSIELDPMLGWFWRSMRSHALAQ